MSSVTANGETIDDARAEVARMIEDETIAARSLVLASLADYDEQPLIDIAGATYSEEQVLGDWMPERR